MTGRSRSQHLQLAGLFLAIMAATLGCRSAEPAAESVPTPTASVAAEPVEPATIMLAIDISLSMLAEDTTPSRFGAATQALDAFLDTVPAETYVGLVSFHGIATLEVAPTTDRSEVRSAILSLQLDEATAIGEAIFVSLNALDSFAVDVGGEPPPARIVLLSDGETTVGRPDAAAIDQAKRAGIAVSTIAFGTDAGTIQAPDTDGSVPIPVPVNKTALAEIAAGTGGDFFEAETTAALIEILVDIASTG